MIACRAAGAMSRSSSESGTSSPRQIARFVTNAEFAQAEFLAQKLFRLVDAADSLGSDCQPVSDAAGKAGGRRLVPHRQFPVGGQLSDVGFREVGLNQRAADRVFAGRLHSRPVIALVVEIRAIHEHVEFQTGIDAEILSTGTSNRSSCVYNSVLQK